ncbi:MAG TPA: bacillithiol biosynthesis cysteine-adding enzyme BshC [Candidatus Acidoferrales bacterium]|nr:bacillithiol biosynthesis cysteine-adding enzyme BshC [Candidatus Acidoferrales bacterium]
MDCKSYPLARLPHASRLFVDFLERFPQVTDFYSLKPSHDGVLEGVRKAPFTPQTRGAVADVLLEQNREFGADAEVERNIERFRAGGAAVVTGQQVGLFSGPAYTFYKALAAVRLARELTESGIEAVPIFWLATEDHDLAEVNQCFWATRAGFERIELAFPEEAAGRPVGEIQLPAEITEAVRGVCGKLEGPSTPSVTRALEESYRSGETLGRAFGRLMTRLFTGRGLILLDPLDRRLHRLAASHYDAALEASETLEARLLERAEELTGLGYHTQVRVGEGSTLLFWNVDGRRYPLERRGGRLHAGNADFAHAEFRQALAAQPERASANVLMRPVVQDALLGTAVYVAGSSEVAYFAQAEVVYRGLGVPMPAILPRPGFTLVEGALNRLLAKYRLGIEDVFEGRQHLRAQMQRESLPGDLQERFGKGEATLQEVLEGLREPLTRLDASLGGALETVERKIRYQYTKLNEKAGRAIDFRSGIIDRHEQLLTDLLYPHRGLQERSLCFLPMLAWQGMPLLDALEGWASPEAALHQVVFLS